MRHLFLGATTFLVSSFLASGAFAATDTRALVLTVPNGIVITPGTALPSPPGLAPQTAIPAPPVAAAAPLTAIPAPPGLAPQTAIPAPPVAAAAPLTAIPAPPGLAPQTAIPAPPVAAAAPLTAIPAPPGLAPQTAIPAPPVMAAAPLTAIPAPPGLAPQTAIPAPPVAAAAPLTAIPAPPGLAPQTAIPAPPVMAAAPLTAIPAPPGLAPQTAIPAPPVMAAAPLTAIPAPPAAAPLTAIPAPPGLAPQTAIPAPPVMAAAPLTAIPAPPAAAPLTAIPAPPAAAPLTAIPAPPGLAPQTAIPAPPVAAAAPLTAIPAPPGLAPQTAIPAPPATALAHTNVHIFVPGTVGVAPDTALPAPPSAAILPLYTAPFGSYETPASLACLARLVTGPAACNPNTLTAVTRGGSKVIVVVDAFDYPTATTDLATFSTRFGLPPITPANFRVVYAAGSRPAQDSSGGWEVQAATDIEMAHALAPAARIVLVEAASNSVADLFAAEALAAGIAVKAGGGEVTNSWSAAEFAGEDSYESLFTGQNVVFLAAAGDKPGTELPSVLSNVVAVGGTSVNRDAAGAYTGQSAWSQAGLSAYVAAPAYQPAAGGARRVPDIAMDADPASGVWICDTTPYSGVALQWLVVGGTGVAVSTAAAIVNNAQHFAPSSTAELSLIYANLGNAADFTAITAEIATPVGRAGK